MIIGVADAHDSAKGVMTLCASLVMIMLKSAPWRLISLDSFTDSTAAIPPETTNNTCRPARESPWGSTSTSDDTLIGLQCYS